MKRWMRELGPVFPVLLHQFPPLGASLRWECCGVGQAALGGQVSLGTLGQHLHHRNAAELTALFFFSTFLNLPFREQQRDRAEQSPREQSLISYTLSFNGVNPEVDLCSDRAEIYYTQFLRRGGFGGREGTGQPVWLCSSAAVCSGFGLQVQPGLRAAVTESQC